MSQKQEQSSEEIEIENAPNIFNEDSEYIKSGVNRNKEPVEPPPPPPEQPPED